MPVRERPRTASTRLTSSPHAVRSSRSSSASPFSVSSRHLRNVTSTTPAIRRRASCRGTPLIRSWSYSVSRCRMEATTAEVTATSDSARPAALRPTRPLPRTEACPAIAPARPGTRETAAGSPPRTRP